MASTGLKFLFFRTFSYTLLMTSVINISRLFSISATFPFLCNDLKDAILSFRSGARMEASLRVTQLQKDLSDHVSLVHIEHRCTLRGHKQNGLPLVLSPDTLVLAPEPLASATEPLGFAPVPCFGAAKRAKKFLLKGDCLKEARALDVIVCGGSWFPKGP